MGAGRSTAASCSSLEPSSFLDVERPSWQRLQAPRILQDPNLQAYQQQHQQQHKLKHSKSKHPAQFRHQLHKNGNRNISSSNFNLSTCVQPSDFGGRPVKVLPAQPVRPKLASKQQQQRLLLQQQLIHRKFSDSLPSLDNLICQRPHAGLHSEQKLQISNSRRSSYDATNPTVLIDASRQLRHLSSHQAHHHMMKQTAKIPHHVISHHHQQPANLNSSKYQARASHLVNERNYGPQLFSKNSQSHQQQHLMLMKRAVSLSSLQIATQTNSNVAVCNPKKQLRSGISSRCLADACGEELLVASANRKSRCGAYEIQAQQQPASQLAKKIMRFKREAATSGKIDPQRLVQEQQQLRPPKQSRQVHRATKYQARKMSGKQANSGKAQQACQVLPPLPRSQSLHELIQLKSTENGQRMRTTGTLRGQQSSQQDGSDQLIDSSESNSPNLLPPHLSPNKVNLVSDLLEQRRQQRQQQQQFELEQQSQAARQSTGSSRATLERSRSHSNLHSSNISELRVDSSNLVSARHSETNGQGHSNDDDDEDYQDLNELAKFLCQFKHRQEARTKQLQEQQQLGSLSSHGTSSLEVKKRLAPQPPLPAQVSSSQATPASQLQQSPNSTTSSSGFASSNSCISSGSSSGRDSSKRTSSSSSKKYPAPGRPDEDRRQISGQLKLSSSLLSIVDEYNSSLQREPSALTSVLSGCGTGSMNPSFKEDEKEPSEGRQRQLEQLRRYSKLLEMSQSELALNCLRGEHSAGQQSGNLVMSGRAKRKPRATGSGKLDYKTKILNLIRLKRGGNHGKSAEFADLKLGGSTALAANAGQHSSTPAANQLGGPRLIDSSFKASMSQPGGNFKGLQDGLGSKSRFIGKTRATSESLCDLSFDCDLELMRNCTGEKGKHQTENCNGANFANNSTFDLQPLQQQLQHQACDFSHNKKLNSSGVVAVGEREARNTADEVTGKAKENYANVAASKSREVLQQKIKQKDRAIPVKACKEAGKGRVESKLVGTSANWRLERPKAQQVAPAEARPADRQQALTGTSSQQVSKWSPAGWLLLATSGSLTSSKKLGENEGDVNPSSENSQEQKLNEAKLNIGNQINNRSEFERVSCEASELLDELDQSLDLVGGLASGREALASYWKLSDQMILANSGFNGSSNSRAIVAKLSNDQFSDEEDDDSNYATIHREITRATLGVDSISIGQLKGAQEFLDGQKERHEGGKRQLAIGSEQVCLNSPSNSFTFSGPSELLNGVESVSDRVDAFCNELALKPSVTSKGRNINGKAALSLAEASTTSSPFVYSESATQIVPAELDSSSHCQQLGQRSEQFHQAQRNGLNSNPCNAEQLPSFKAESDARLLLQQGQLIENGAKQLDSNRSEEASCTRRNCCCRCSSGANLKAAKIAACLESGAACTSNGLNCSCGAQAEGFLRASNSKSNFNSPTTTPFNCCSSNAVSSGGYQLGCCSGQQQQSQENCRLTAGGKGEFKGAKAAQGAPKVSSCKLESSSQRAASDWLCNGKGPNRAACCVNSYKDDSAHFKQNDNNGNSSEPADILVQGQRKTQDKAAEDKHGVDLQSAETCCKARKKDGNDSGRQAECVGGCGGCSKQVQHERFCCKDTATSDIQSKPSDVRKLLPSCCAIGRTNSPPKVEFNPAQNGNKLIVEAAFLRHSDAAKQTSANCKQDILNDNGTICCVENNSQQAAACKRLTQMPETKPLDENGISTLSHANLGSNCASCHCNCTANDKHANLKFDKVSPKGREPFPCKPNLDCRDFAKLSKQAEQSINSASASKLASAGNQTELTRSGPAVASAASANKTAIAAAAIARQLGCQANNLHLGRQNILASSNESCARQSQLASKRQLGTGQNGQNNQRLVGKTGAFVKMQAQRIMMQSKIN